MSESDDYKDDPAAIAYRTEWNALDDAAKLLDLCESGATDGAIAFCLGVSVEQAREKMAELGIEKGKPVAILCGHEAPGIDPPTDAEINELIASLNDQARLFEELQTQKDILEEQNKKLSGALRAAEENRKEELEAIGKARQEEMADLAKEHEAEVERLKADIEKLAKLNDAMPAGGKPHRRGPVGLSRKVDAAAGQPVSWWARAADAALTLWRGRR